MDASAAVWGVIGVVGGAIITGIVQLIVSKADYTQKIQETCIALITPLQNRIEELDTELKDWKNWAERLVKQVKKLGQEPVPFISSKKDS